MRDSRTPSIEGPDVLLDVPVLKVEDIFIEVEFLRAHVSLVAEVLDLVKLSVGADAALKKVKLEIKGVEAEAQLRVRLDHVAAIVERALATLDRNPEILRDVGAGVESAGRDIGTGTRTAMADLGEGGRSAAKDTGKDTASPDEHAAGDTATKPDADRKPDEKAEEKAEEKPDEKADEKADAGAGDREEPESTTVHDTLAETKESVRDLSRALLRRVPGIPGSSRRGPG